MRKIIKNDLFPIILGALLFITAIIFEAASVKVWYIVFYALALCVAGGGVFLDAVRGILRGDFLDEKLLMTLASVGAMIIGEYKEGVAVMLFFLVGEMFEHRAVRRSRASVRSLMDINPDIATVIRDGEELLVDSDELAVGDTLVLRPGDRVPADCTVINGSSDIDTSSLTGEAQPRSVSVGDTLASGVVVTNGALLCRTDKCAEESSAARILSLVEGANENKSKEENFITVFSRYYTPIVVGLALLMALLPPVFQLLSWRESLHRALVFLVISCPCALVISVPMAFFGGIGSAASRGVLFKGGNVFSAVARADTVAFDKTGTLTTAELVISAVKTYGTDEKQVISLAAIAERGSNHPIALAITKASPENHIPDKLTELAGRGIVAEWCGKKIAVGNKALLSYLGIETKSADEGVLVACDGEHIGTLFLTDTVKPEAEYAITALRSVGISHTALLSGDRESAVRGVAEELGITEWHSELSPEDKYSHIERLIGESHTVMYAGDGINDTPTIARADVGIAMGGVGQDSAIEAADIVIMSDELTRIGEAILIARKTLAIAKENIVFALGVKIAVMLLGAFNIANLWLAVFADVGVAVLAILNSMRALAFGKRAEKALSKATEKSLGKSE